MLESTEMEERNAKDRKKELYEKSAQSGTSSIRRLKMLDTVNTFYQTPNLSISNVDFYVLFDIPSHTSTAILNYILYSRIHPNVDTPILVRHSYGLFAAGTTVIEQRSFFGTERNRDDLRKNKETKENLSESNLERSSGQKSLDFCKTCKWGYTPSGAEGILRKILTPMVTSQRDTSHRARCKFHFAELKIERSAGDSVTSVIPSGMDYG
uniref:Uncharacterized protein n=1 Tax=Vespula pensylvanica TaxID=30213 RepID=A0A834MYY4_VESPE|nr:hypothetical protein H0235_017672 [Vespula pensylvanica]